MTAGLTQAIGGDIPDADVYVALTFDDGPTGSTTEYPNGMTSYLLDGLKERGAHATFFMCGYRLKDFNSHCSRYLAEGHELGNHTMNHPMEMLPALSEEGIREEVESNSQLIEQYCGARPTVMRPVGGAYDEKVQAVMKELGLPIINWEVDTLDWKTKTNPDSVKQKHPRSGARRLDRAHARPVYRYDRRRARCDRRAAEPYGQDLCVRNGV